MEIRDANAALPLSVVIPAWNEEREIRRCLDGLSRQTAGGFEVIVVDNGSTDRTASIAAAWGAQVLTEPRRGIAYARQTGFDEARCPIVASTDADAIVPPDWIARIRREFAARPDVVGIFGPFHYQSKSAPKKLADWSIPLCYAATVSFQWITWRLGRPHFPGANFAIRREAFSAVSGFRSPLDSTSYYSYWEDVQLGLKLRRIGEIRYLRDLVVQASARKLGSVRRNVLYPARQAAALHLLGREL